MLFRYAGLHCVSITGWAKGASYRPGDNVTSEPANHSWNAVYIDGSWFLIDCHWATRHDDSADVKSIYDDFYFLTDPSEMIYSHFPEDDAWQLLQTPWTRGRLYAAWLLYPVQLLLFCSCHLCICNPRSVSHGNIFQPVEISK